MRGSRQGTAGGGRARRRYARDAACACGCGMIHSCSVTGGTRPEDWPARRPVAGIQLPGGGRPALLREERGAALHVRAACVRRIPAVAHRAAASSRWLACRGDGTRSEQEMARRQALDGAKQNAPAFPEREYPGRKTRLRGWVWFVGPLAQDAMARTYCRIIRRIGNVAGVALGAASPAVRATAHGVVRGDQSAAEMTPVQASAGLTHQQKPASAGFGFRLAGRSRKTQWPGGIVA